MDWGSEVSLVSIMDHKLDKMVKLADKGRLKVQRLQGAKVKKGTVFPGSGFRFRGELKKPLGGYVRRAVWGAFFGKKER